MLHITMPVLAQQSCVQPCLGTSRVMMATCHNVSRTLETVAAQTKPKLDMVTGMHASAATGNYTQPAAETIQVRTDARSTKPCQHEQNKHMAATTVQVRHDMCSTSSSCKYLHSKRPCNRAWVHQETGCVLATTTLES